MDYASGGELEYYLINQPNLKIDEKQAKYFMSQIWRAVSYWHSKGIIHRDLKPENILITYARDERENDLLFNIPVENKEPYEDMILKVTDFGIAGIKRAGLKGEQSSAGTVKFMAPELRDGSDFSATKALDIWSLGIILYMAVVGEHPFYVKSRDKTFPSPKNFKLSFSNVSISENLKDLLKRMLDKNPMTRITMFEILNHKWFDNNETPHESPTRKQGKQNIQESKLIITILEDIEVSNFDKPFSEEKGLGKSFKLKDINNSDLLPICK